MPQSAQPEGDDTEDRSGEALEDLASRLEPLVDAMKELGPEEAAAVLKLSLAVHLPVALQETANVTRLAIEEHHRVKLASVEAQERALLEVTTKATELEFKHAARVENTRRGLAVASVLATGMVAWSAVQVGSLAEAVTFLGAYAVLLKLVVGDAQVPDIERGPGTPTADKPRRS